MSGTASTGVFHRVEKKYILNQHQFECVSLELRNHMNVDNYNDSNGEYSIISLYYDTLNRRFISQSFISPGYKEKLRIRTYNNPATTDPVYVEIKKKVDGTGNKRRFQLPLYEAYHFLETGFLINEYDSGNVHVLQEIQTMRTRCPEGIFPYAVISYDRLAFNGSYEDPGLRVSFDFNIKGRTDDLRLELGPYGDYLIDPEYVVMEIKALDALPLWLTRYLSLYEVYPSSYSKYKTMYHKLLKTDTEALHVV